MWSDLCDVAVVVVVVVVVNPVRFVAVATVVALKKVVWKLCSMA